MELRPSSVRLFQTQTDPCLSSQRHLFNRQSTIPAIDSAIVLIVNPSVKSTESYGWILEQDSRYRLCLFPC
jgi:hypothetical protein